MVDQLAPNLLTVDPVTGGIGEDFSGHVHAAGLDLDASTNSTPPSVDRIRWIELSDGAVVADVTAFRASGISSLQLDAYQVAAADTATFLVQLFDDLGAAKGAMQLTEANRGATSSLTVTLPGRGLTTIADNTGLSNFLQAGAGAPVKSIVAGGTLTWPGGTVNSNTLTLPLAGATGVCNGVASAQGDAADLVVCSVFPAVGGVQIVAARRGGSIPAAPNNTAVSCVIWGT